MCSSIIISLNSNVYWILHFFGIKRKCGAISFHCEQFISDFDDIDIKISLVIIIDRINGTFEIIL